jgi:hypothetical protein
MALALSNLSLRLIGPATAVPAYMMIRRMTTDGLKTFHEKERAAETIWFNKEEEKLIKKMIEKAKAKDPKNAKFHNQTMESLADKYKMSEADRKVIMQAANGMTIAGLLQLKTKTDIPA